MARRTLEVYREVVADGARGRRIDVPR
jgi:hypothetical protein